MTREDLPAAVAQAFRDVEHATDAVIAAAGRHDTDAIHEALVKRGDAIVRLEPAVDAVREHADPPLTELLKQERASLDSRAHEAEQQLKRMMQEAGSAIDSSRRGGSAVRAYSANALPATTLDRSG